MEEFDMSIKAELISIRDMVNTWIDQHRNIKSGSTVTLNDLIDSDEVFEVTIETITGYKIYLKVKSLNFTEIFDQNTLEKVENPRCLSFDISLCLNEDVIDSEYKVGETEEYVKSKVTEYLNEMNRLIEERDGCRDINKYKNVFQSF